MFAAAEAISSFSCQVFMWIGIIFILKKLYVLILYNFLYIVNRYVWYQTVLSLMCTDVFEVSYTIKR